MMSPLLPDLSSTRYDSGLKVGVNLFFRSCLDNTVSPSFTSLSRAQRFSSAYSFPFSLASLSLSRTSWSFTGNSSIPVIRVRSFLWNRSSEGLTPVMLCGVVLYIIRKEPSFSFQFLFSICAIFILFNRKRFCLSSSPFA